MPTSGEASVTLRWQALLVFKQRHSKKIRDFPRAAIAEFFVEAHRALERRGSVERNADAILAAKFGFGAGEQLGGDSSALPIWKNSHAAEMSFALLDGLASNRANDFAGQSLSDEHLHVGESILECFRSEDGIEVRSGRVRVAIGSEGRLQTGENLQGVVGGGVTDGNCRVWPGCSHSELVRIRE